MEQEDIIIKKITKKGDYFIIKKKADTNENIKQGSFVVLKENTNCIGGVISEKPKEGKWQVLYINLDTLSNLDGYYSEDELIICEDPFAQQRLSCDGEIIKDYDSVELIIDKPKYSEIGVFKGARGTVMECGGCTSVEVDFIIDEASFGKSVCCSFEANDLRVIKDN